MKRFLIDFLLIVIFVLLGRELIDENRPQTIEERIDAFNQQVENGEIIQNESYLHLNQTEENIAGKIGEALGGVIEETLSATLESIAYFFDENE